MNGFDMQWATPLVQAVGWSLVHFLWQGALAGLAAAALLKALRGAKASTRYAVAVGLLAALALLPVATALRLAGASALPARAAAAPAAFAGGALAALPAEAGALGAAASQGSGAAGLPLLARLLPPVLPWVFGAWLLGVLLFGFANLGGWWQLRRLVRQARPLDGEMEERLGQLSRRLGIARAVRLLESAAVPVPALIGWLRPAILVPASTLVGLSPWQLDAILVHELAHVRRHDYLVNLLQAAVETLLFYHPATWWLSNQVRRERESCCDDLAVELCGDRLGYARALADLEGLRPSSSPRLALAADGGSLGERVRRLVGAPVRRSRRSWVVGLLALALLPAGLALGRAQGQPGRPGTAGGGTVAANAVAASGTKTNLNRAVASPATASQAAVSPAKASPAMANQAKASPAMASPATVSQAAVSPATVSKAKASPVSVSHAAATPATASSATASHAVVRKPVLVETVVSAAAWRKVSAGEEKPAATDSGKENPKGERGAAAAGRRSKLSDDLTRLLILKPSEDCLGDLARASQPGSGDGC